MSDKKQFFVFDGRALGCCGRNPKNPFDTGAIVLTIEDTFEEAYREAKDFGEGAIYSTSLDPDDNEYVWVRDVYK